YCTFKGWCWQTDGVVGKPVQNPVAKSKVKAGTTVQNMWMFHSCRCRLFKQGRQSKMMTQNHEQRLIVSKSNHYESFRLKMNIVEQP
ncbi:MAG TPA: hypothetical protein PKG82_12160, partial [Myxococcota bacterium]|nr:hypothetical protein [Myxococcota bacterium]